MCLALWLKSTLLIVVSLLSVTLLLVSLVFITELHGFLIMFLMIYETNNLAIIIGLMIECRSTILTTGLIQLVLIGVLVLSPVTKLGPYNNYLITFGVVLLAMLSLFALSIQSKRDDDQFVWASYRPPPKTEHY